jgi:ParB family chromosome partitioning protein
VPWIDKLLQSCKCGDVTEAILLMNSETDTGWFQRVVRDCSVYCFVAGRLKFRHQGRAATRPASQGQVIFYFGRDPEKFMRMLSEIIVTFAMSVLPKPVVLKVA